jgi:hypothetical protein
MPMHMTSRRAVIGVFAALPLLSLPGCTGPGSYSLDEAVRRLLTLSTQRAFARLLQPDGFIDDQLVRIVPPSDLGNRSGTVLRVLLQTPPVRNALARILNNAAGEAAERAAPIVTEPIRSITLQDAVALVRAGPQAATDILRQRVGDRVVAVMIPEAGEAIRLANDPVIAPVLQAATGVDVQSLANVVASQAADGIFKAIGREEAAIRADPAATRDPLLMGVFGLGGAVR